MRRTGPGHVARFPAAHRFLLPHTGVAAGPVEPRSFGCMWSSGWSNFFRGDKGPSIKSEVITVAVPVRDRGCLRCRRR